MKEISYGENHYLPSKRNSIHSEVAALKKAIYTKNFKKNKKKKFNLVVIKISKRGKCLGNSRPCEKCVRSMIEIPRRFGFTINKVIFSNADGSFTFTSLDELKNSNNNYVSGGYKKLNYKPKLVCRHSCCECEEEEEEEEEDDED